ncbi:hypothetical protein ACFLVL_00295 [Chloroflexota bacterium]
MKEYDCVEVNHHKDIGRIIREYQENGWHLHTYQTAGMGSVFGKSSVKHYLLFDRDK